MTWGITTAAHSFAVFHCCQSTIFKLFLLVQLLQQPLPHLRIVFTHWCLLWCAVTEELAVTTVAVFAVGIARRAVVGLRRVFAAAGIGRGRGRRRFNRSICVILVAAAAVVVVVGRMVIVR